MSSEPSELSLELVRRDADACVLAVSGELSLCSAGLVTLWGSRTRLPVPDLWIYAARSYSLSSPPSTNRRLIRWRSMSRSG
jgi:hypothetical protein